MEPITHSELEKEIRGYVATLNWHLGNCGIALQMLCELHRQLTDEKNLDEIKYAVKREAIEDFQRVVFDYLIVRFASLFDNDSRAVSLKTLLRENERFRQIENLPIVTDLLKERDKAGAHNDSGHRRTLSPPKVLGSELGNLIEELKTMIEFKSV